MKDVVEDKKPTAAEVVGTTPQPEEGIRESIAYPHFTTADKNAEHK